MTPILEDLEMHLSLSVGILACTLLKDGMAQAVAVGLTPLSSQTFKGLSYGFQS